MKHCPDCDTEQPLDCFNNNSKKSDGKQSYCRECQKKRDKKYYEKRDLGRKYQFVEARKEVLRAFLADYLAKNPCNDCGEKDPIVLEFDHVNGDKKYEVSNIVSSAYSLDTLKTEIAKCEVRCANCHRRKTAKQFNWKVAQHYSM